MATDFASPLWDGTDGSRGLVDMAAPIAWRTARERGLSILDAAAVCDSAVLAVVDAIATSRQPPCRLSAEPFDVFVQRVATVECDRIQRLALHRPHRPVVIDLTPDQSRLRG